MLRNWLILVSEQDRLSLVEDRSSYKAVQNLKDVRVSLLSGEYSGVVVLSILESDTKGFPGFISGLKNHPELKKVQVVLLDKLKSMFSADDQKSLRFFSIDQIGKLIDLDFSSGKPPTEVLVKEVSNELRPIKKIAVREDILNADNLEFLKHICATTIVNMVLEGEVDGERREVLEVLSRRVLEG